MLVLIRSGAVVCLTIGLSYSSVFAQEQNGLRYGVETDFNSIYLWRAIVLDDRPSIETSAWIGVSGLSLTAWGKLALSADADRTRLQRSGLTLDYSRKWKRLTIEPTVEAYRWPTSLGIGMEGSLRLKYKVGPIHAFTEHAFDILEDKGAYFGEAGLGHQRQITKKTEIAVQLSIGWASSRFNNVNIGVTKPAVNILGAETSVTQYLSPHLYIRPHFTFINIPDRQIREGLSSRNITIFGFAMGFEFKKNRL